MAESVSPVLPSFPLPVPSSLNLCLCEPVKPDTEVSLLNTELDAVEVERVVVDDEMLVVVVVRELVDAESDLLMGFGVADADEGREAERAMTGDFGCCELCPARVSLLLPNVFLESCLDTIEDRSAVDEIVSLPSFPRPTPVSGSNLCL